MAGLKPNEEIMTSAAVLAVVYGVFQLEAPPLSSVKNTNTHKAGSYNSVHKSVKTAIWSAIGIVGGISLLAKSPTIFVVGGLATAAEGWRYYHANASTPQGNGTSAIQVPSSANSGTPTQPGSQGNGPS